MASQPMQPERTRNRLLRAQGGSIEHQVYHKHPQNIQPLSPLAGQLAVILLLGSGIWQHDKKSPLILNKRCSASPKDFTHDSMTCFQ